MIGDIDLVESLEVKVRVGSQERKQECCATGLKMLTRD